jgi:hypothetical protein
MNKKIKAMLFSTLVLGVLCAGTATAVQLQKKASLLPGCTGTCSATKPCNGPCICQIFSGTTGSCVRDPGPVRPQKSL